MKNMKLVAAMMLGMLPLASVAQRYTPETDLRLQLEEGRRLCDEGHYYAARQTIGRYLEALSAGRLHKNAAFLDEKRAVVNAGASAFDGSEAEAIANVCDYYLNASGTSEAISRWLAANQKSPERNRLELLYANLLVRDGKYEQALAVYAALSQLINEGDMPCVPEKEREAAVLYEAVAYINIGDIQNARLLLSALQGTGMHTVDVTYYTAYVNYAEGNYAAAIPGFTAVADSRDYKRKAPVYLADCLLQTGRAEEALAAIREYKRTYGNTELSVEADRIEGESLYDMRDYYGAIERLTAYKEETEQPKCTALYKLGMSFFNTAAYGQAAASLSASAGTSRDEMAQNAWLHAGISYLNVSNKKQAQIAFQQASEMGYDRNVQEEALYNYALCLHDGGTMGFGESVGVFERFLNSFPNSKYSGSVAKHLTEVYFTTKNYNAALESINKIKNPGRDILSAKQKVLFNLGKQCFMEGNFAEACAFLGRSEEIGVDAQTLADTYYWKGEAEYRTGEYVSAATSMKKYISSAKSVAGNVAMADYTLGYVYFKRKNYGEALRWFENVNFSDVQTLLGSDAGKVIKADTYNRIGDCMFAGRRYDDAYTAYQMSLDTDASQGDYSLLQQSFICGLRGDYDNKVALLAQIESRYGNSQYAADAMFEKGRAYVQRGDKQTAMSTFNALLVRYPQSAASRKAGNELGLLYYEMGRTDDAVAAYKSVISLYPNTEESQTALANLKDIFTTLGRVNEYAVLAEQAGSKLSADELDKMVLETAIRAMSADNYRQAYTYYRQLREQTQEEDMRMTAMTGELRAAYMEKDYNATIAAADMMLQSGSRASADVLAEARFYRAESLIAQGDTNAAVADLQVLATDTRTVYGAQAVIRLAEYAFETAQYQSAETVLLNFIDSGTPHAYWLARGFVLLADVYMKTGRDVEAREYLLSLKSNYSENEEINRMVEERLR
ncbi:MAG: tetratricopeptide repeat protein [Bacteroides sp.]|nr:tetratricopeptide repeat protein [Roseburia sp.]MCM1346324.1 tetratricopeptide repeat protein [Bacteroides sp.]MCM1420913.1 tetratricopeptide repeat protein [Bacteroides sp.]